MLIELAAERACIEALEGRIMEFEQALSALRAEKRSAQERLDSYKYPICRRWRYIALATSALWRAISFSGNDPRELVPIRIWLSRSNCAPLSIKIRPGTDMFPREWEPVLQQTTNLLRWTLELPFQAEEEAGPQSDISLPSLEYLTVTTEKPMQGCLASFILPALRRLEVPEDFLGPKPKETLTSFLSKSRCKLHEVHITGERSFFMDSYREEFQSIPIFSSEYEDENSASEGI
ncbi:hypothetical protein C8R47DRAFT_1201995 [Mycena vitilis]|nr:hypothetical protein C8R47DRAFT_1201995 [Mycena vitilis]